MTLPSRCVLTALCLAFLLLPAYAESNEYCSPATTPCIPNGTLVNILGIEVVEHTYSKELRYLKPPQEGLGALVRIVLGYRLPDSAPLQVKLLFNGKSPDYWVEQKAWSWYEMPANALPNGQGFQLFDGTFGVFTFNAVDPAWGEGKSFTLDIVEPENNRSAKVDITLAAKDIRLRQIHFPKDEKETCVVHIENGTESPIRVSKVRFYAPTVDEKVWQELESSFHYFSRHSLAHVASVSSFQPFPKNGIIPPLQRGGVILETGPLPFTRGVVEVQTIPDGGTHAVSHFAPLMFKQDSFDIGAGWLSIPTPKGVVPLTREPFHKLLRRLQINTAHFEQVAGYTDDTGAEGFYTRYPLKRMSELKDVEYFSSDAMLPGVHGVDCLGEPQMGVSPMDSWKALRHYHYARYPTTVTLSEDKGFREYAGLSDYPHFDAYRVSAPAADSWFGYKRWPDGPVPWGAPLEGIGEMVRTLRAISRPKPVALWSQNVHEGWQDQYFRLRKSPTSGEILLQAYEGLANGVTSHYWYSLQSDSTLVWRDTLAMTERIGIEMRMLDDLYLRADAYWHERRGTEEQPEWDLNVLATPTAAILFAMDLAYVPDREQRVFSWPAPRALEARFPIPQYLGKLTHVFRIDGLGVHAVAWEAGEASVLIRETIDIGAIFIATEDPELMQRIASKHAAILAENEKLNFDPIRNDLDFAALAQSLGFADLSEISPPSFVLKK